MPIRFRSPPPLSPLAKPGNQRHVALTDTIHHGRGTAREDTAMRRKWQCDVCGFLYDETTGLPGEGIPPGTDWDDLPGDWVCPDCAAGKEEFHALE